MLQFLTKFRQTIANFGQKRLWVLKIYLALNNPKIRSLAPNVAFFRQREFLTMFRQPII